MGLATGLVLAVECSVVDLGLAKVFEGSVAGSVASRIAPAALKDYLAEIGQGGATGRQNVIGRPGHRVLMVRQTRPQGSSLRPMPSSDLSFAPGERVK